MPNFPPAVLSISVVTPRDGWVMSAAAMVTENCVGTVVDREGVRVIGYAGCREPLALEPGNSSAPRLRFRPSRVSGLPEQIAISVERWLC